MHWIIGGLWYAGLAWVAISHGKELFNLKSNHLTVYSFLFFALVIGFLFLYTGKIRSVIFDRREFTVTLKKRNTCCDRRSIVTYNLAMLSDIKAVNRTKKIGGQDHRTFYILMEFEANRDEDSSESSDWASSGEDRVSDEDDLPVAEEDEKELER